jgi:hypothetical protein
MVLLKTEVFWDVTLCRRKLSTQRQCVTLRTPDIRTSHAKRHKSCPEAFYRQQGCNLHLNKPSSPNYYKYHHHNHHPVPLWLAERSK